MSKDKKDSKDECCARFKKGKKPCKGCPRMEELGKKERRKLLEKYR